MKPPDSPLKLTLPLRMRRMRRTPWMRDLVRETQLTTADLIWPLFLSERAAGVEPVASMPAVNRLSLAAAVEAAQQAHAWGIPALALFPNTPPHLRDEFAREADNPNNLICRAIRAIKKAVPEIGIITDVALDPYTTHGHDGLMGDIKLGHDGLMQSDEILNDATVAGLVSQAITQAEAGADIIAPSDMMDGRVGAIRAGLDAAGFTHVAIMSYAAKYASAFYGPFREAVGTNATLKGDKRTYQMDPANTDEALREVALDIQEGADMVIVKPALPYLDIVWRVKDEFKIPTFAYQVSGEYAMLKAAAERGFIDEPRAAFESLLACKRAGADGILTYYAPYIAQKL
jgi:porphobilinogen synthase